MITLRKTEKIKIYQVELALKEKTTQSPFIAVLILAQEQGEINAETLKEYLLPTLPIRACNNLLIRLTQQGYLEKKRHQNFRNNTWYDRFYDEEDENYYNGSVFTLSELGEQSAVDKSFWVGEKGIYNVYVSDSNLLNQQIIKIEKVERAEDDRNGNRIIRTPNYISQYQNQILTLNKKKIRIDEIEEKCFQLKPLECLLEIEAKDDDTFIRIKEKQTLFQSPFEINENELKEELLSNTNEFKYDKNKKAVLSEFNQDNISFNRKVKLRNPFFQNNQFNSVEIENVAFIPSDERNAELWLNEILFKGIEKYFLDDKSFNEFAENKAKPILEHYNIKIPTRKQFSQTINKRENAFYQIAKLETIDCLNY
jgi:hypothetical protein